MTGQAKKPIGAPRGLAGPKAEKTISLALQGGGAHGAFTWGVLDAILEDGRLANEAITGVLSQLFLSCRWAMACADGRG
jgi:NTE family protein